MSLKNFIRKYQYSIRREEKNDEVTWNGYEQKMAKYVSLGNSSAPCICCESDY